MALGVPCVATAVGGNVELLEESAGKLVRPGDSAGLVEAIKLVLNDASLAWELARKAREKVLSKYTWDVVLQQYLRLYSDTELISPATKL